MTHFALLAPPFRGHMNPMLALARELVRRGHRTTFLQMQDAEPLVAGGEVGFRALGQGSHPPGALAGITRRMSTIRGLVGLGGVLRDVAAATDMFCRELPAALGAIGADALICDQTEAAGGLVAAHLGMPHVSVANALPLNREPGVPPPFTAWRYDPTPWGTERNLGGYRVSDLLMRGHARVIADHAAAWRLGTRRTIEDCASPLAQLSQTVAGFDMPRHALPDSFHHVGPLRDPGGAGDFRLPEPDGRPLVYASLGTLQGGRVSIFRRIAEAARRLDVRLLIAHGGGLTPGQVASLPGRPAVHDFVPQDVVLRAASLAVLNGGLNTVMDSLAAGVPIVAVPIAFEQGAIAARLERAGAGRGVSRRFLTAGRMSRAMSGVLATSSPHRARSGDLAGEVATSGGVRLAADIVETVARTGRPVTRAMVAGWAGRAERAA